MNLCVFQKVLKNSTVEQLLLSKRGNRDAYYEAYHNLLYFIEKKSISEQPVKEYILTLMLEEDSVVSIARERGHHLENAIRHDCEAIFVELLSCDWKKVGEKNNGICFDKGVVPKRPLSSYEQSLVDLVSLEDCEPFVEGFFKHIASFGIGALSRYPAYQWFDHQLKGIESVDLVDFKDLVGLEKQKGLLIDNTESFIQGNPCNNVLLYGSRGTGKSSCIKALMPMFYDKGLRLIQLAKEDLRDFPKILDSLKGRWEKFILFLDDLSFENGDLTYKYLKIILEGQLEKKPKNVLVYATSNRKHLMETYWSDRKGVGEEINKNETLHEKLSLADRFGIHLLFMSPDQEDYLAIVRELLSREGFTLDESLEKEAILWELTYHGRSGRTAVQFVNNYISRLK